MKKKLVKRFLIYDCFEKLRKSLIMTNLFLFLALFNLQMQAGVFDTKLVNLSLKNASIFELLGSIEEQTGIGFLYNESEINTAEKINVEASNTPLSELLRDVLPGLGVDFEINDSVIILKAHHSGEEAFVETVTLVTIELKGKITDKDGIPLPGATIVEDGTLNGVTSDIDGNFTIKVASTSSVLKISYIGFTTQLIPIGEKTEFEITLAQSATGLNEVVVTGYQTISKERATGSYTVIKEEDISRQITTNVVDRLEGLTTGLLTTVENGDFGDEIKLTLRGLGTFYADDQPLIVVDGFPIEGGLETVNPIDIESITVLKDAASASIWGVRAGNGVIVIKTKRGEAGKPKVEFSTYYSIEQKPDLNNLLIASSASQIEEMSYSILNGMDNTYANAVAGGSGSINAVQQAYLDFELGIIDASQLSSRLNTLSGINSFAQVEDLLLRNAVKKQYNFSIKGGSEYNKYYASVTLNDDEGKSIGDDNQRVNINLKDDIILNDKLTIDIGVNTTFSESTRNSEGLGLISGTSGEYQVLDRFQNLVDANGNRLDIPRNYLGSLKREYEDLGYLDWSYNPLTELESRDVVNKTNSLRMQAGITWTILPELKWRSSGIYTTDVINRRRHASIDTYEARNLINTNTLLDAGKFTYQVPMGGILREETVDTKSYTLRTQLDYDKTFSEKHELSILAGIEARQVKNESKATTLLGYNDDLQQYSHQVDWSLLDGYTYNFLGVRQAIGYRDRGYVSTMTDRFISFFANASYTFDKKYTVSGSAKLEQSSIFGVDAKLRANKLWSIGAAWNISDEDFFNVDQFTYLKFRTSYGVNGNVRRGQTTETVLTAKTATAYQIPYLDFGTIGNPFLTHEDNFVTNIALDFGLFDSRIRGSVDYYSRRSKNLLSGFSVSTTHGFPSQFFNNGEIVNRGIEINLGGDIIRKSDFTWNVNFNFTYNKGEVVEYNDVATTARFKLGNSYNKGVDPGAIFAYQWAGLSADGTPQIYDENGDVQSWDVDVESPDALIVAGTRTPPYFGSLNNVLKYKNFTLGVYLTFKFGHKFIKPTYKFNQSQISEDIDDRWMAAGDENSTDIARFPTLAEFGNSNYSNWDHYYVNSDAVLEDASYIRIRDISLSYDIDEKWLSKLHLKGLSLTAQVRNVGMLWKATDLNIDPDILPQTGGFSGEAVQFNLISSRPGVKPSPIFSFGVMVKF